MALLSDLRNLLSRKKPTQAVDLSDTQARSLGEAMGGESTNGPEPAEPDTATVETRPIRFGRHADAQRSQEEVLGLVRRIGDHLDAQIQRTDRLMAMMDRLPRALEALPEINRQNARLLEVFTDHLSQARAREDALNKTLGRITDATQQQTEVLGLVQQQLDTAHQSAEHTARTMDGYRQSLRDLSESHARSTELLADLMAAARHRDDTLGRALHRTQQWNVMALMLTAAAAVVAVGLAAFALLRSA